MTALALFALGNITGSLFWIMRVAAALGAMIVGWFAGGPVVRVLYRGLMRRPTPRWLVPSARLGSAALLGLLVYFYLPLGGGAGLGWGPGAGGGPGLGPGSSLAKSGAENTSKQQEAATADPAKKGTKNLEIELIGGKRYQGDGRFYLIKRREPVVALEDVEKYLVANNADLAEYVTIVLAPNSVDAQHGAVLRLATVIEKYGHIPRIENVPSRPPAQSAP